MNTAPLWLLLRQSGAVFVMSLLLQFAVVTAKGEIVLDLATQHKLGILQGLVAEQPVQFCPLCRGVAVLILDGDAVDGKELFNSHCAKRC